MFFFFQLPAPTDIYTLSLHDALPISLANLPVRRSAGDPAPSQGGWRPCTAPPRVLPVRAASYLPSGGKRDLDRKSTRLNSSHPSISYAVFCLKKKKKNDTTGRFCDAS